MIRVLLVGSADCRLFEDLNIEFEGQTLKVGYRQVKEQLDVRRVLASWRPHVIFSFFPDGSSAPMKQQPWNMRRRWVNYPFGFTSRDHAVGATVSMYQRVIKNQETDLQPLVSILTPIHNIGSHLLRAFNSLLGQTYRNWEWVIYDDSTDGESVRIANSIAREDHRVSVYRGGTHSGIIGAVKRRLFKIAEGDILLELDHDDELTEQCLEHVVDGLNVTPDCGFAYTDFAEVNENGSPFSYGERFAFGFGSYHSDRQLHNGRLHLVARSAPINLKTLSHIVGVPNHARAWRRAAYVEAGGHNPDLRVADDYELLLRTFLVTRFVHVGYFGYVQNRREGRSNTHLVRNAEIQSQVAAVSKVYQDSLRKRATALVGDATSIDENHKLNVEYEITSKL